MQRLRNLTIDTAITTPIGVLVCILLTWLSEMPWWLIGLCSVLPPITIWGVLARRRIELREQAESKGRFFLDQIRTMPKDELDNDAWIRWQRRIEALFRGAGYLRKSHVLQTLIAQAGSDRRMVAEHFLMGLAREATHDATATELITEASD